MVNLMEESTMSSLFSLPLPKSSSEIHALDPDLPFLASEAAVDLANLISGESDQIESIQKLASKLSNSIKTDSSGAPSRAQMNPDTLTILGGAAVASSSGQCSSQKVDDLIARALEISEILSNPNVRKNREKLYEAMSFCVALSQAAIAYRQSLRNLRPSHPFRR